MDPITEKVIKMHETLFNWFNDHPSDWRPEIDTLIQKCSGGKYRVFQTFFETTDDCLSGNFQTQVLTENDIKIMYPSLLEEAGTVPQNSYLYIFTCNGALNGGKEALIGPMMLEFE
jgi:hypothetical protein